MSKLRTQPPERRTQRRHAHITPDAINRVATIALLLQDGDDLGAVTAAREACRAAGDPLRALLTAAALVDVDRPIRRWWDPAVKGQCRCLWCDEVMPGGVDRRRRYCAGGGCALAARRAMWRTRERQRRAVERARAAAAVAS